MKLTITANIENGRELSQILSRVSKEYDDGVGAYCLPAEKKFGLTADMQRVSPRDRSAVAIVEFGA